jgi:hypothetical protein
MASVRPTGRTSKPILRYTRQQGLISRPLSLDDLFIDCDLGNAGGPDEPF